MMTAIYAISIPIRFNYNQGVLQIFHLQIEFQFQ